MDTVKSMIRTAIGKHLDLDKYALFLHGSRIDPHRGSDRSDVDIGIEGPQPVPLSQMSAIEDELEELPILYTVDVLDMHRASPDVRAHVQNHREFF